MAQVVLNYIDQLKTFIGYPTISSDSSKKEALIVCARWLKNRLLASGLKKVIIFPTAAHPVVYAEHLIHPSLPTILFYGHYDVQPVDPISEWQSPPFKAAVKGAYLFGRGASDDKGQLFIHIIAVEQLLKQKGTLPVNVKFLIEGAEEIGSAGLQAFIQQNKDLLQCQVVIVSDTKMASIDTPAITYSLRGALNAEVMLQTSFKDVHSGTFGGSVPNAIHFLSTVIHQLHLPNNKIAIPEFYEDVEIVSSEERTFMRRNSPGDRDLMGDAAATWAWGEAGFSPYERTTIRPSLAVTGISGGYQGEGVKNVIPASASFKLNFRLVPNQQPEKVKILFEQYLKKIVPPEFRVKTVYSSFANPVKVSRNHPYLTAAANALESVFHKKPKMIRAGGTIPAVDFMTTALKVPVILIGFAQAGDNMHAPNEMFYLPNFFRGIETIKKFILDVGHMSFRPDDKPYSIHHQNYRNAGY